MESSSWLESLPSSRIKAIQELTQGQQLTNKLREMLRRPEKIESDLDSVHDVVGQILGMFDNTLSILTSSSFSEVDDIAIGDIRSPSSWDGEKSEDYAESIKTVKPIKPKRGCYKRRKDSWNTSIKITSRLVDDGYAWRKYGQKVIQNTKHHRNYYRCTHKIEQGCRATKQVQKTDDEPPQYKITYNGHHTCKNFQRVPLVIFDSDPDHKDNSLVLNFESKGLNNNKKVDTCLPSRKHSPKEGLPSSGFRYNQSSSSDHYLPWELTTQVSEVPSEPRSVMSSGLDQEDMITSDVYSSTCCTHGYEIDNVFGSNVFSDFNFELCS